MKYVLDSNVALKWELIEAHSAKAIRIRDDARLGLNELIAPDISAVETAHSLTRAERQARITPAQGSSALAAILADAPSLHSALLLLDRAYSISSATRQGVYDCLYVALAEREGCQLVTADDKLIRNLQSQFPFLISLASFP